MKMMKSILLGSAAGLVAVTAGQAADLPGKARPVQYAKICSLYGAGFYYMPGTDMCLKIGGWVRAEVTDHSNGNITNGPFNNNSNTRSTNNLTVRARGYITADVREETAYGVARGYISVGLSSNDVGTPGSETSNTFGANRAFVQWAGFTAGLARSFYDFYTAPAQLYRSGYLPVEDTSDGGWWVWAYTAQFGGGFSATLSAEARRMTQIIGQGTAATSLIEGGINGGLLSGQGYGGWQIPDIVANLRVDQAWGSAQVMGALHEVNAPYYGSVNGVYESNGHPGDAWGWAVGAGAHLNTPFITPGDYFEGEINYSEGATKYDANITSVMNLLWARGANEAFGLTSDCVYGGAVVAAAPSGTSCQLTTAWSGILSYEHYWTPQWHESFTGTYMAYSYNTQANAILCSLEGGGNGSGIGTAAAATAGCNNNFSYWGAGSRLQWDVTKNFYIGVEALYIQENTAGSFNGLVPATVGIGPPSTCGLANGNCVLSNEHDWAFTLRMHKDFLP